MWINPIGIPYADALIADSIRAIKAPNTYVEVVSLSTKPSPNDLEYLSYAALFYGDTLRVVRHAADTRFDAAVIGCFYDPILTDVREISGEMVVVGPCQASVQVIANLCNRFSVIVAGQKEVNQMSDNIHHYGYGRRLASIRALGLTSNDFLQDENLTRKSIAQQASLAIAEDFAEGIILGCTLECGLAQELSNELRVPVIDCVEAAFSMAEYLGGTKQRLEWTPSRQWSCAAPPEYRINELNLFAGSPPIGNRVTVDQTSK